MNGSATESVRCTGNSGRECGRDIKYFGHSICRLNRFDIVRKETADENRDCR